MRRADQQSDFECITVTAAQESTQRLEHGAAAQEEAEPRRDGRQGVGHDGSTETGFRKARSNRGQSTSAPSQRKAPECPILTIPAAMTAAALIQSLKSVISASWSRRPGGPL
jgi:hypothetical protein